MASIILVFAVRAPHSTAQHSTPKRATTAYNMFVAEYMKKNQVIDEYGVDHLLTWQAARQAWKELKAK